MSHRALVIEPTAPGRGDLVNVYRSRNGAHRLELYPILESRARRDGPTVPTGLDTMPSDVRDQLESIRESFGAPPEETELIDSDPLHEAVPVDDIASVIDFIRFEAIYVLNSSSTPITESGAPVEVFIPAFVDVAVGIFFTRFVEIEIYNKTDLPADHETAFERIDDGDIDPIHRISREEYLTLRESAEPFEYFVDNHQGILQTLFGLSEADTGEEMIAAIVSDDAYIIGRTDTSEDVPLPDPYGRGMLIRMPVEEFDHERLSSLYHDWRHLVARLRATHSLECADAFMTALMDDELDEFDPKTYERDLISDLTDEFGSSISPLTPGHYRQSSD